MSTDDMTTQSRPDFNMRAIDMDRFVDALNRKSNLRLVSSCRRRGHLRTRLAANSNVSTLLATCLWAFLCVWFVDPIAAPDSARGLSMLRLVVFGVTQFGLGLLLLTVGTRMISATRSPLIGNLETPLEVRDWQGKV
jgi:hypothetical protein